MYHLDVKFESLRPGVPALKLVSSDVPYTPNLTYNHTSVLLLHPGGWRGAPVGGLSTPTGVPNETSVWTLRSRAIRKSGFLNFTSGPKATQRRDGVKGPIGSCSGGRDRSRRHSQCVVPERPSQGSGRSSSPSRRFCFGCFLTRVLRRGSRAEGMVGSRSDTTPEAAGSFRLPREPGRSRVEVKTRRPKDGAETSRGLGTGNVWW